MKHQPHLLTVLGCSSSLALALTLNHPAIAAPADLSHAPAHPDDVPMTALVQSSSNPILDALSCSCASCVMAQSRSW
ncbi:hypothetical protein [Lyngbya confervoides]|uniref:Secreted protein n=1 Tax=Lyngbya confervoides BDU141951 TaxID=1574623 RepID=A0ABD4T535_9CYAN|nr:hypothetical protein [Lyngbya confervoides]MCM1983629.1 hypothetical protein [Lyngbya confervoides BDU141951]